MITVITVRYRPGTGKRGSRWLATSGLRSMSTPYDYATDCHTNRNAAAEALATRLGLKLSQCATYGGISEGENDIHVFLASESGLCRMSD
jgi:hypothetical protein